MCRSILITVSRYRILIDTGEGRPSWIKAVRDILHTENAQCNTIITHKHIDHVGGIDHLLELYPKTKIYKYDPGEDQHEIKDNQVFKVEGATLRAVHTPGFVCLNLTRKDL
jgi:endoribonuclease LACTB2